MWFSSMFALIVTNDSHWKENALRNITLCVMQALFSTSPKNSRMKKLKTQGKNLKLKHKTQGFGKSGKIHYKKQGK